MATHLIGGPEVVKRGLVELQRRTGAEEIMLSTRTHSYEARARSLELVAEAWQMPSPPRSADTVSRRFRLASGASGAGLVDSARRPVRGWRSPKSPMNSSMGGAR